MLSRDLAFNRQSLLQMTTTRPLPLSARSNGLDVSKLQRSFSRQRTSSRERDREGRPMFDYLKSRAPELWQIWYRLNRLRSDLHAVLPSIQLTPIKLERQTLLVTASSSAMAARLRQYEPRVIDGLQARGWLINRVKFRPYTSTPALPLPSARKAAVSPRSVEVLAELAASEHITPELRSALETFVTRQREYLLDDQNPG